MINKFKKFTKSNKIVQNFSSLFLLKILNMLLPLITFPYLVRVLGAEKFGLLGFVGATIAFFQLMIDFGFTLSATKQISIVQKDIDAVAKIYSAILSTQLYFILIGFIILNIIIYSFEMFKIYWYLYYATYFGLFSLLMFPQWLFQGLEKMKFILYITFFSKLIYTIAIYVLIEKKSDFYLLPIIGSLSLIISGLLAIYVIHRYMKITFRLVKFTEMLYQVKESYHIFIGQVAVSLYTTSTTLILGLFTNDTTTGYYVAAQRLIFAIRGLFQPILDATYPHISKQISKSNVKGLNQAKKLMYFMIIVTLPASMILYFYAEEIILLILGEQYVDSINVFQILSFLPFIIGVSNVMGVLTMLNFNLKKEFSSVLILGGITNVVLSFFMVPYLHEIGSAFSVLIVEIVVLVGFSYYWYIINKKVKEEE